MNVAGPHWCQITSLQVMARWHQAPSHYLGQCWHRVRNLLVLGHLLIKRSRTGETAVSYCIQNQVKIHPRSGKSENLFAMSMLANSPRALNNFQMENPNPNPKEEYCQLRWQVVAIFSFFPLFFTFCTIQLRICNALFVVNKIKPRYIIKSPQSGVTLYFQFVSPAAPTMTFAPHVKTVSAKP